MEWPKILTAGGLKEAFTVAAMRRAPADKVSKRFYDLFWKEKNPSLSLRIFEEFLPQITLQHLDWGIGCFYGRARESNVPCTVIHSFYKTARSHPLAHQISSSMLHSALYVATQDRDGDLVELLLSYPSAMELSVRDVKSFMLFALPEGHPEIKRMDSRRIDYAFGAGDQRILNLCRAHIEKLNVKSTPAQPSSAAPGH